MINITSRACSDSQDVILILRGCDFLLQCILDDSSAHLSIRVGSDSHLFAERVSITSPSSKVFARDLLDAGSIRGCKTTHAMHGTSILDHVGNFEKQEASMGVGGGEDFALVC